MKRIVTLSMALWAASLHAQNLVISEQKISSTNGNFTAHIDQDDRLGVSMCNLGDVDGDGINDIAFGSHFDDDGGTDRGSVYIGFLQSDGKLKPTNGSSVGWIKISDLTGFSGSLSDYDHLGISVGAIGDVDGDGIPDLAIGANEFNFASGVFGAGSVWICFLNADGTVRAKTRITDGQNGMGSIAVESQFGVSVSKLSDLDGDGIAEIMVGSTKDDDGGNNSGAFYILFLNSDGTVRSYKKHSRSTSSHINNMISTDDHFGRSVSTLGDFNNDGIDELVVGSPDYSQKRGAVYAITIDSLANITAMHRIAQNEGGFTASLNSADWFGNSLSALSDTDGDGYNELLVGAPKDDDGGTDRGAVYVLQMSSTMTVKSYEKISHISGGFGGFLSNGDLFGRSIIELGDINGDGMLDIAAGANFDDDGGQNTGALWVMNTSLVKSAISIPESNSVDEVVIYPNPLTGDYITVSAAGSGIIELYSMEGRLINAHTIEGTMPLDLSGLLPGVYFYIIYPDHNIEPVTGRIIRY